MKKTLREKLKDIVQLEAKRPQWQRGQLEEHSRSTCTTPRKPVTEEKMELPTIGVTLTHWDMKLLWQICVATREVAGPNIGKILPDGKCWTACEADLTLLVRLGLVKMFDGMDSRCALTDKGMDLFMLRVENIDRIKPYV